MSGTGAFAGKTALVTGAARGLGFAIARQLIAAGARVAINDLRSDNVETALAQLGPSAVAAVADLATADGPDACVRQARHALGGIDFVVNNAAINIENPIEKTTDELWDAHLHINLRAPQLIVGAALPDLIARRGAVLNIASELGLHAVPNNVAYVAAKHGLVAWTRAAAMELALHGVRVNALCPGTMDTELMRDCAIASGNPEQYYKAFNAYHPIGRIASPDEVAAFALTLLSSVSGFMTGTAVAFDGGSTAGRPWVAHS